MKIKLIKLIAFAVFAFALPNIMMAQGSSSAVNANNKMNVLSFNKYLPNASVDSGFFTLKKSKSNFCVKLSDETTRNKQHYMIENCFDISDFKILNNSSSSISRNSGVLVFKNDTQNSGVFTFKKNQDFVEFLKREKVELNNDLYYFKLFLGDIDESYVLDIKKLGFQPTITELGRLVWHDASIKYIKEIHTLFSDFSLSDISMLSAHDISVDYLQEFIDVGIKKIDFHSIKKSKKMGITPQMIENQKGRQ